MAVEAAKKQGSIKPRRMKAPKPFKKRIEPWLWLMPALVFFLVFTYYPFIKTVVSSFFVVNKMGVFKQFAGFDNYVRVLKDRSFQTAIQNTFIYVLLASPVSILIALLLALVIGGLLYISAFSLVYLKKAYDHCLELGITRKELSNVIKSSLIFSVVPSLSIVVGLFVLIAVLGSVWAWWRLSVIGSLSYETMISSSIAQVLGYASSAEMLESATGRQFGVVMILMSVGMLSGFLILLPLGKKLCKSVDRSAAENGGSTWKNVLSGVFMLVMFSVYIPILLFTDNVQAAVMITGLVIAIGVGVLAKRPGLAWLNNFVMAFSMLGGLISSLAWVRIFG